MAVHSLTIDGVLEELQFLDEDQSGDESEMGSELETNSNSDFEVNFPNKDSDSSTDDDSVESIQNVNRQLITCGQGAHKRVHCQGRACASLVHANNHHSTGNANTSTMIGAAKYKSPSGIVWTEVPSQSLSSGHAPKHNMFTLTPGSTPYTKQSWYECCFIMFIDESMLKHIQKCTQEEAHQKGNESWQVTLDELDAFIGLLYAHGALGHNTLRADDM